MHECENRAVSGWAFAVGRESAADGPGASEKSDARNDVAAKFTHHAGTKSDSKQLTGVRDLVQLSDFLRSYFLPEIREGFRGFGVARGFVSKKSEGSS